MPNRNQIGLAGEFAVLSQLLFRGFDANITLGNTKSVDILVSNPDTGRGCRVEVKTGSKKLGKRSQWGPTYGWRMHKKHEIISNRNLFYCFVFMDKEGGSLESKFFVLSSKAVSDYVKEEHSWWRSQRKRNKTTERTFRLGTDNKFKYPVRTPLASRYENRWQTLG